MSIPKLTSFPSGAAMLDVKVGAETYVLEYHPNVEGVGISKMSTATYGWEGYEHCFDAFELAKAFLVQLLESEPPKPTKAR